MKLNSLLKAVSLASLFIFASASQGAIIASTDFDGRTVSGETASNLNWVVNGVAALGDLSAAQGSTPAFAASPVALFDTSDASDLFAVDRNINDEGSWFVDLDLSVLGNNTIDLDSLSLDASIFNNSGAKQNVQRLLNMSVALFDDAMNELYSSQIDTIFTTNGSFPSGNLASLSFDLGGSTLSAGGDYTVRITAFGDLAVNGNNAGFDNLQLIGTITEVSAPSAALLLLLAGFGVYLRKSVK